LKLTKIDDIRYKIYKSCSFAEIFMFKTRKEKIQLSMHCSPSLTINLNHTINQLIVRQINGLITIIILRD